MTEYWPRRDSPKGFSIENLTKQYKDKINLLSKGGMDSYLMKSPYSEHENIKSTNILTSKYTGISSIYNHWANRDFREYIN